MKTSCVSYSHAGATPVLADVDPLTDTIDPDSLERAVTGRTKAVMPVHLYGHPADMHAIARIAARNGLLVIEDACQAHGARYRGTRAGSLGHAAAFSFYPAKNLGAFGDGGAVVTNDAELAEAVRVLRDYGQRRKHEHVVKGYNRRLDTLQAALLRTKLRHLDDWNIRRRRHAAAYAELLDGARVQTPRARDDVEAVWHLYVIRTEHRDALRAALAEHGIQTGIHYPVPIHLQAAYGELQQGPGSFPVTERHAAQGLSLPMYPELDGPLVEHVARVVREHAAEPARGVARRDAA